LESYIPVITRRSIKLRIRQSVPGTAIFTVVIQTPPFTRRFRLPRVRSPTHGSQFKAKRIKGV